MNERVTVIMPCYNDGLYIEDSINSVKSQTYEDIELLVIDDGSDDEQTVNILKTLEAQGKCHILHTEHVGVAAARNHGISCATGKYIMPVDSDDIIDPTYIEKCVNIMRERPEVGVVYCYADLFGEAEGRWNLPDYSFKQMIRDNVIFITALFYKEDWEKVGGFNKNMIYGMEDYDFWIGILELEKEVYQIPEILFHYRIKKRSRTTSFMDDPGNVVKMYTQIYDNHPEFYRKHAEVYAKELRETLIEQIFQRTYAEKALEKCKNERFEERMVAFVKRIIKRMRSGK